jgi:AcrR family transcriptional regulator
MTDDDSRTTKGKDWQRLMGYRENPRPGGRSARVQAAVHQSVRDMLARMDRADITIPLIAQHANVTPSTIYRRWGDLQELLADVAAARLQPEGEPARVGSARDDLEAWVEQYADEMASGVGRQMLRDILAATDSANAEKCGTYTRYQLSVFIARAEKDREPFPTLEELMDHVISPIIYRILFDQMPAPNYVRDLIAKVMLKG